MSEQRDATGGGDPKPQPIAERLRFLVKERRHVQLGVVDHDLLAAAKEIDRLRAGWIESDKIALEARVKDASAASEIAPKPVAWAWRSKNDGSYSDKVVPVGYVTFVRRMEELKSDPWVKNGHAEIVPLYAAPQKPSTPPRVESARETVADTHAAAAPVSVPSAIRRSEWTWSLDQPEVSAWRWIETWDESAMKFGVLRFHLGDKLAPNVACWRYVEPPRRGE